MNGKLEEQVFSLDSEHVLEVVSRKVCVSKVIGDCLAYYETVVHYTKEISTRMLFNDYSYAYCHGEDFQFFARENDNENLKNKKGKRIMRSPIEGDGSVVPYHSAFGNIVKIRPTTLIKALFYEAGRNDATIECAILKLLLSEIKATTNILIVNPSPHVIELAIKEKHYPGWITFAIESSNKNKWVLWDYKKEYKRKRNVNFIPLSALETYQYDFSYVFMMERDYTKLKKPQLILSKLVEVCIKKCSGAFFGLLDCNFLREERHFYEDEDEKGE